MYPITDAVRALYEAEARKVLRITGTDRNGESISITDANVMLNGFAIDRFCCNGETIEIGTATAAELQLTLNNAAGTFDDIVFEGAELFVEIGIADWSQSSPSVGYMPCGYFTPDEQPRKLTTISMKALDRMTRFDVYVNASALTFPTTVAGLVAQSCTLCTVPFSQTLTSLPNYNMSIAALPDTQEKITYRNLIQWCAGMMGTNAFIDWTGSLQFAWYNNTSNYVSTTANRYSSDLYENAIEITGVEFTDTDDASTVYLAGTDDYTIDLSGNPLINSGNASTALNAIYTAVHNFTYTPFSASVIAAPYLWPMDRMTFTDKDGNGHVSLLTNVNFVLNGTTQIAAKGKTEQMSIGAPAARFTPEQLDALRHIQKVNEGEIDDAVAAATAQITGADGGYVRFIYDASGKMIEIVIMDTEDITTATKVWRWNSGGLGYSSNGYAGPYTTAITQNGAIVADFITTGFMSANRISGGTIDGSTVNAKLLNIVDANGNVIASFNSVITLGKATDAHAEMDFNSFDIYDNGGNLIFTAGDLRDANGRATVMDRLMGNGVGNTFNLTLTAISVTGVTIDGTPTSGWSLQNSGREIRFTSAPADGAEIKVTYVTEQPVYRYDIGIRLVNSLVGINSVASGYSIEASGAYSHAEGLFTKASGDAAHAEGDGTQASGTYSHAEGMLSKASGNAAHAEGNKTQASGTNSHAEGNNTEASGGYSHAEGYKSKASAFASHAEGEETQALGTCCHAEGCGTIASGFYQHVFGSYNEISAAYAEIVGNGTADNARANARTLDWSGNEWIAGALSVGDAAGTRGNLGVTPANIGAVAKAGDTMTGQLNLKPATGEGGQIQLGAATNAPSENGINIDNNHGVFRIFGQASADGTSKTGNGSFISFDPYLNRFRVLSGLSPGPALEINGDGTISVAYPANWRTALGAAAASDIAAKIYSVRGEIVKSATTGTAVGVGKATVQVVGKTVIVDFEAKITTAGTLNNVYNIGIQVSNLRALNSDIPAFTVVNGGNIHYYTAGGVLDTGHEGYAGEASANVSGNNWNFGRMYTTTGSVGLWSDDIYTVGMYVTGTLLGVLN